MNATNLPVMVWIHGGGYGQGNGAVDLSGLINDNNNSFIGVAIQYRVCPFYEVVYVSLIICLAWCSWLLGRRRSRS